MGSSSVSSRALIECGLAVRPRPGELVCGDLSLVRAYAGGVLLAVVDGLGHGAEAAAAARLAVEVLERHAGEEIEALMQHCHQALNGTRGAVMTLATVTSKDNRLRWLGVGNVEAVLLRGHTERKPTERVVLRGGLVGFQLPPLRTITLSITAGDIIIFATDGLKADFVPGSTAFDTPDRMAERMMEKHFRGTDDALVMVAKYLGAGHE